MIAFLLGTGVHFDAVHDNHWPYPTADDLAADGEEHVGQSVLLFGTVTRVDEGSRSAEIAVSHAEGRFSATVRGFDATVRPGGVVQVYGTLERDRRIDAERVVVVNPTDRARLRKYAVSLAGAAIVVVGFLRHWRLSLGSRAFEAR